MNIAVILAGGTGTRLGVDIPKQYIEVEGKPVIGYCLDIFFSHPMVDAVQIVAEDHWRNYILKYIKNTGCSIIRCTSRGFFVTDAIYAISFRDMAKLGT